MKIYLIGPLAALLVACGAQKSKPDAPVRGQVSGQVSEPPADSRVAMPQGAPVVREDPSETASEPSEESAEGQAFVDRAELDAFVERGPSYVLTVVIVEPVHRNGQFQGYQITDVTRGAREFITPQLRVGDIVTHVNGIRLMRPEDYMQAWRSLEKVGTILVDFVRQNEPSTAVWVVR